MLATTEDHIDLRMHDHNKWEVLNEVAFFIAHEAKTKIVTVHEHFMTDGASVPVALHWCIPSWHRRYGRAALLHDFLYVRQGIAAGVAEAFGYKDARQVADAVFFSMITGWRRYPMWIAVRLFGGFAWRRLKK